jgi:uncharacterized protein YjbI with pentapeptide repeats
MRLAPKYSAVLAAILLLTAGSAHAFKASDVAMLRKTRSCFKCDFRGVTLAGENHFKANLRETDMTGAILVDIYLAQAFLEQAIMRDANLRGANLRFAKLQEADLSGADLTDAQLIVAWMQGTVLRGAVLDGADLQGADLAGADLTGASLARAKLFRTDLRKAKGLTQAQLDRACGDASTRVPAGLVARRC